MLRVALSRLHGLHEKLRHILDYHGSEMAKELS